MARIDIKQCTIKFKDGTKGSGTHVDSTGAVANTGGYTGGDVSNPIYIIDVDTFLPFVTTPPPIGTIVNFAGHDFDYILEEATLTTNELTSIRISPMLQEDIADDEVVTLFLTGDSFLGNEIDVKIGEGNITWTETRNIDYFLDRGLIDEVKEGDEAPMEVTLDFQWEYIKGTSHSGGVPTVVDVLKQAGSAASWVSTDPDICRPFAVDIEVHYLPQPNNCGDQEVIVLPDFRYDTLDFDLRESSISCTGRCNAKNAISARYPQA